MEDLDRSVFRVDRLPPYPLGSVARAVHDKRSAGVDVIDLSQINPDMPPPQAALDRAVQAILIPHHHRYSSSQGISKLREAFAAHYARVFHVNLDAEREIVVTMGVKEGLAHLLLAMCSPGESVLLPTPAYPIHSAAAFISGLNVHGVPLFSSTESAAAERYELNEKSDAFFAECEKVHDASWPRPRAMILSFPHNPTATTVTAGFFERLVSFARERGIYLIHDFAYGEMSYGAPMPSLLATPGARDIAVEFSTLSKSLQLPGWRIGCCAGNERLVSALRRMKSYLDFGVFQPLQIGAIQALRDAPQTLEDVMGRYAARREVLVEGLRSLGWGLESPRAGVVVWAEIPERHREKGSTVFAQELLDRCGVAASPGEGFDSSARTHIRFALVENESRIRLALERMKELRT